MKEAYVAIDLETTGLNPSKAEIIEIGAAVFVDGVKKEEYSKLIRPLEKLPERIIEITHITDEMLEFEGTEQDVVNEFLDFFETAIITYSMEPIILGHNVGFDYSFIKTAAVKMQRTFECKAIDTLKLARELKETLPKKTLDAMCEHYGIFRKVSHRAFEDAIAAAMVYEKLKEEFYEEHTKAFVPLTLAFEPAKQEPMTEKQKKYLNALIEFHKLNICINTEDMTKSKASRMIDKIILEYGMLSRR